MISIGYLVVSDDSFIQEYFGCHHVDLMKWIFRTIVHFAVYVFSLSLPFLFILLFLFSLPFFLRLLHSCSSHLALPLKRAMHTYIGLHSINRGFPALFACSLSADYGIDDVEYDAENSAWYSFFSIFLLILSFPQPSQNSNIPNVKSISFFWKKAKKRWKAFCSQLSFIFPTVSIFSSTFLNLFFVSTLSAFYICFPVLEYTSLLFSFLLLIHN